MRLRCFVYCLLIVGLIAACSPTSASTATVSATLPPTSTALPTRVLPTSTPLPTNTAISAASETTTKPQTVLIYLVTVGDNGASGEMIGCGDSLVGVEVAIEPTTAVLRAALNALFNLSGDMTYGQSGLYNALYLSDLQIESLDIVERQAILRLTGDLIYGGECDIPRIEAQLNALVLQFPTVDTVTIYVNDILLTELLDLRG
jgi:hypothetical protein